MRTVNSQIRVWSEDGVHADIFARVLIQDLWVVVVFFRLEIRTFICVKRIPDGEDALLGRAQVCCPSLERRRRLETRIGCALLSHPHSGQDLKMNDTDVFCKDNQTYNFTDQLCQTSTPPPYGPIDITTFMHIFPSIYGILCTVGVIANGLVIYAVAACKKKMVSDIYVLNLAIADMLFLLVMPFNIHQLVRDRQWVFGNFMCKAVVVVDVSNQFTTVGIVTVLCIDR